MPALAGNEGRISTSGGQNILGGTAQGNKDMGVPGGLGDFTGLVAARI